VFATATDPSKKNAVLMLFVRSITWEVDARVIDAPAFLSSDMIEIAVALEFEGTMSLIRAFSRGHCTPHANAARSKYGVVVVCVDNEEEAMMIEMHAVHTHINTATRREHRPCVIKRGARSVPKEDNTNLTESQIPIPVSFTPLCLKNTPRNCNVVS